MTMEFHFMIGASFGNNYAGISYIVYGLNSTDPPFASITNLNNLQEPNGVTVNGINPVGTNSPTGDISGSGVSYVGDVNGDNISDVLIGARLAGGYLEGASYLIYGWDGSSPVGSQMNLVDLE